MCFLHKHCRRRLKTLQQANGFLEGEIARLEGEVLRLQRENSALLAEKAILEQEANQLRRDLDAARSKLCLVAVADHVCNLPKGHQGEHKELGDGGAVFLGR